MSAILEALTNLNRSLEGLEQLASDQQKTRTVQGQQDLFVAKTNGNSQSNGHIDIDPAILAKKLDMTIERVEQLLAEG